MYDLCPKRDVAGGAAGPPTTGQQDHVTMARRTWLITFGTWEGADARPRTTGPQDNGRTGLSEMLKG